jgi:hypothetical protein
VQGFSTATALVLVLHLLSLSDSPLAQSDHLFGEVPGTTTVPSGKEKYSVHTLLLQPCVFTQSSSLVQFPPFATCGVHVLFSPFTQYNPIKHWESEVQASVTFAPVHFPLVHVLPGKQVPSPVQGCPG